MEIGVNELFISARSKAFAGVTRNWISMNSRSPGGLQARVVSRQLQQTRHYPMALL